MYITIILTITRMPEDLTGFTEIISILTGGTRSTMAWVIPR